MIGRGLHQGPRVDRPPSTLSALQTLEKRIFLFELFFKPRNLLESENRLLAPRVEVFDSRKPNRFFLCQAPREESAQCVHLRARAFSGLRLFLLLQLPRNEQGLSIELPVALQFALGLLFAEGFGSVPSQSRELTQSLVVFIRSELLRRPVQRVHRLEDVIRADFLSLDFALVADQVLDFSLQLEPAPVARVNRIQQLVHGLILGPPPGLGLAGALAVDQPQLVALEFSVDFDDFFGPHLKLRLAELVDLEHFSVFLRLFADLQSFLLLFSVQTGFDRGPVWGIECSRLALPINLLILVEIVFFFFFWFFSMDLKSIGSE